jgi:hypothetical protein
MEDTGSESNEGCRDESHWGESSTGSSRVSTDERDTVYVVPNLLQAILDTIFLACWAFARGRGRGPFLAPQVHSSRSFAKHALGKRMSLRACCSL